MMHEWQIESYATAQRDTNNRRLNELDNALSRLAELKTKSAEEKDLDTQEALLELAFSVGATCFTQKLKGRKR
jgi:hypothetical protein